MENEIKTKVLKAIADVIVKELERTRGKDVAERLKSAASECATLNCEFLKALNECKPLDIEKVTKYNDLIELGKYILANEHNNS